MEGDSGLPIVLGTDLNTPGHDVLNGNQGNDRYFAEGGDDILISGTGLDSFLGQLGHDWVTHYNEPRPADSDLLNDVFAAPLPLIVDFDRFSGVEGLSGWHLNDTLRGDHLGTLELATDPLTGIGHELDAAGIARINGLAALLPPGTTSFSGGNIIIGGGGSDRLEGRGGDDIIDGDAWLRAQLMAPLPGGGTQLVDSMLALQEDVFAGLIDPGDISIVRSIETNSDGIDTAVFSGPLADYDITFNVDSITVDHVRGDGLSTPLLPSDPALDNGTDTLMNVELLQFADQTVVLIGTQTLTFEQNVNGYTGTVDTYLQEGSPNVNNSTATEINVDLSSGGGQVHGLLRFDDIFGSAVGQVPLGATIASATLELEVTDSGDSIQLHRMLQGWNDTDSWNSLASGIQADDVQATTAADATTGSVGGGLLTLDVTTSLTAWIADPAANLGWAVLPTGSNGVDYFAAEGATPPRLIVEFAEITPDVSLPTWTAGVATAFGETNTTVDLSWSGAGDDVGVTEYNVYVNGSLDHSVLGTSTTVTGLAPNTTFTFTIQALDAASNESTDGPSTTAATTADVTLPSWTVGQVTASNEANTTVDLSWSGAGDNIGVTGYNVYVNGSLYDSVLGTSTTVTGLAPSTTFTFTIQALDAASNESTDGPSAVATTTTPADVTLPTWTAGQVTASNEANTTVDLSWSVPATTLASPNTTCTSMAT